MTPLRQRMLEDLQIRHYSPTTIRLYLYAVRAFAKHFGKPPDQLGSEHIRRYQLFLTKEKKVSTSTYVMMICGLRFFYTHTLHPQGRHRTHSVSAARTKAAVNPKPGRSPSVTGGAC